MCILGSERGNLEQKGIFWGKKRQNWVQKWELGAKRGRTGAVWGQKKAKFQGVLGQKGANLGLEMDIGGQIGGHLGVLGPFLELFLWLFGGPFFGV